MRAFTQGSSYGGPGHLSSWTSLEAAPPATTFIDDALSAIQTAVDKAKNPTAYWGPDDEARAVSKAKAASADVPAAVTAMPVVVSGEPFYQAKWFKIAAAVAGGVAVGAAVFYFTKDKKVSRKGRK